MERFDELFDTHKLDVAAYCRWRVRPPIDPDDVLAEVFLVAWRRLDEIPIDRARLWLYATARRVIANQRRSHQRLDRLRRRIADEPVSWPNTPVTSTEEVRVHEALARLGERDREVLLLAEWEGLTPAEIAEVIGCRAVTARGRLHRARSRFRDAFVDARTAETTPAPVIREAHT